MIRLLIADDEPLIQAGVKSMLEWSSHGIEICGICSNGSEALEMIGRFRPEIVISDIWMPEMDGLTLLKTCRNCYGDLPVFLMLTGHKDFGCARKAIHYGAAEYILKQELTAQSLEHAVRSALQRVKNLQQTRDMVSACLTLLRNGNEDRKDFTSAENPAGKKRHRNVIDRIQKYMQENCTGKLTLRETASAFGLSPNYLSALFTKSCGYSFTEYRNHIKIEEAKRMLDTGGMKIYEVAEYLGFDSAFYFSKVFKKTEGIYPREYLRGFSSDKSGRREYTGRPAPLARCPQEEL